MTIDISCSEQGSIRAIWETENHALQPVTKGLTAKCFGWDYSPGVLRVCVGGMKRMERTVTQC